MLIFEVKKNWRTELAINLPRNRDKIFLLLEGKNIKHGGVEHPRFELYSTLLASIEKVLSYDNLTGVRSLQRYSSGTLVLRLHNEDYSPYLIILFDESLLRTFENSSGCEADWKTLRSFINDWSSPLEDFTLLKTRFFPLCPYSFESRIYEQP